MSLLTMHWDVAYCCRMIFLITKRTPQKVAKITFALYEVRHVMGPVSLAKHRRLVSKSIEGLASSWMSCSSVTLPWRSKQWIGRQKPVHLLARTRTPFAVFLGYRTLVSEDFNEEHFFHNMEEVVTYRRASG